MILKSIKMQNFRKYKNVGIDFPDGVVGIFGLNGVGKSTIFEAFAWALYGHTAARTSSDKIKRDKALPSDRCRVEVEFVFNQNKIRVIREMIGKNLSPSAVAYVNDRIVANGSEATTRFIQNLFGMDAKTFFTSIYAKQKELNALSSLSASERKQLVMRMLGIDALDKAIKNIRSDIRKTQEIISHYQISIRDEKTGRDKEEIYREEIDRCKRELDALRSKLHEKAEEIRIVEEGIQGMEREKEEIQRSYEEIQARLEEERKKRDLFERRKRLLEEIENLKRSILERKKEMESRKKRLTELEGIKKEYDDVEEKIDESGRRISEINREIEREKTKVESLEGEMRKIEDRKTRIESLGPSAPCPTCERPLGDQYSKLIEKFDREIREKREEADGLSDKIKRLEEEVEREKKLQEALMKKRKFLLDRKMEWERISAQIESARREVEREEKEVEMKVKEVERIGDVRFDEESFRLLEGKASEEYERYKEILERLRKRQIELERLKEERNEMEAEIRLIDQRIKEYGERIDELRKMREKMEDEKKKLTLLNTLEKIMGEFRMDMISRIRPTLSAYASSLMEILTEGKYSQVELNENYDIMIYDGGKAYEIGRFSGGEEDLANLCIRLSISQMLADRAGGEFNMIILDEIFGSQDVNRRRNILNTLTSLSSRFRQIFVVTHIEEIKQMVDNAIIVYEDEDGSSRIKVE